MPSRAACHALHRPARSPRGLPRPCPGSLMTLLVLMGGTLVGPAASAQPRSGTLVGEARLNRQIRIRYTESVQPQEGWNGQVARFGAPLAPVGRAASRLRGSAIAELPLTARTRVYARLDAELKARREEPGRALQTGAGAGVSMQLTDQAALQVDLSTQPGQKGKQMSVMLQLQL